MKHVNIFCNKIIEYDIMNEEQVQLKKKWIQIIDKTFKFKFNKLYSERNITENIKIFLQLYMIMTDLLTCHQDLIRGGCY